MLPAGRWASTGLSKNGSATSDASSAQAQPATERFTLSSPDAPGCMLAAAHTCDGWAETPSIIWSGAPSGTVSYAVTMHTQVNHFETHADLVVYDTPQWVSELPTTSREIGTFGANSIIGRGEYAPRCSLGPGMKDYVLTVFALQSMPTVPDRQQGVTREELLSSTSEITLASASITVGYTRPTNS